MFADLRITSTMKLVLTLEQLLEELRERKGLAGSQKALAADLNISDSVLSDVLKGRRDPPPSMLSALRLTKEVRFVREVRVDRRPAEKV